MSSKAQFAIGALSLVAALFTTAPATAGPINYSLGLNSLPSAQGWTLNPSSNIGESIFTANGTLAWNTMPYDVNVNFQNYSYYTTTPATGTYDTSPWTLTWDVKVRQSEPATPSAYWAGAYTFVGLGGYNLGIGLGTNNISIFKEYFAWSYSYNFALPSAISDWTRITLATTADHSFSIALDGVLLDLQQSTLLTTPAALGIHKFGAPSVTPAWDNKLGGGDGWSGDQFAIGDGSIGSNADTETGCWYLTQLPNANVGNVCADRTAQTTNVPEPAGIALVAMGLLALARTRRRD